jgi:uncharacterized protein YodC (DUF2158 family)
MSEQFKVGDTVRLNSGGPILTITELPSGSSDSYTCRWYEPQTAKFEVVYLSSATLRKVGPDS